MKTDGFQSQGVMNESPAGNKGSPVGGQSLKPLGRASWAPAPASYGDGAGRGGDPTQAKATAHVWETTLRREGWFLWLSFTQVQNIRHVDDVQSFRC